MTQTDEALVNQAMKFVLDNEMVEEDVVVNNLILSGFMASNFVQDVEVFINKESRSIEYVLYFNFPWLWLVRRKKLSDFLKSVIQSALSEYSVTVEKKRYVRKDYDTLEEDEREGE